MNDRKTENKLNIKLKFEILPKIKNGVKMSASTKEFGIVEGTPGI